MQELKKENYELKLKLQESGNLIEMVVIHLYRIESSVLKSSACKR